MDKSKKGAYTKRIKRFTPQLNGQLIIQKVNYKRHNYFFQRSNIKYRAYLLIFSLIYLNTGRTKILGSI